MIKLKTNHGEILLDLDAEKAPLTVENFLQYVKDGFFTNTLFHRVIDGFMIQGGGMNLDMSQKTTRAPVKNEADNGLKNDMYTVAMARDRDPNSATSQFYINLESNKHLNYHRDDPGYYGHCVFGKIVKGLDIMKLMAERPTGAAGPFSADVPLEPIVIEKVALLEEEIAPPPVKSKSKSKTKGKSHGKTKNESRRHLAGS